MPLKKVYLNPKKDESLRRFHPWVFSGAIHHIDGVPAEGELVEIYDSNHQFLALGHYQIGSIAVRIVSFEPETIDNSFWKKRLTAAYQLRRQLGLTNHPQNDTYRLVHGEGDWLPGLIIDIYGHTAVMQAHSPGMHLARHALAEALQDVLGPGLENIYYKSEDTLPYKADLGAENGYLAGGGNVSSVALENGLRFRIDWMKGQKTGFFVDQRQNRSLLEQYARDRKVLNLFGYTGGFSCYALRGGALSVHSVDSSAKAIALTDENIALNFPGDTRHQSFTADAFKYLEQSPNPYDLIILDPPAFAKHRNVLRNALQGYRKLNAVALEKIQPGGILFTFSCSQVVSKNDFRLAVFSAAAQSGRKVRIIQQLAQPADHPVNIYHPEGEYLKGLVLAVE
jgi:23S rRNA (cytosine1962-C5)-methyltransferase